MLTISIFANMLVTDRASVTYRVYLSALSVAVDIRLLRYLLFKGSFAQFDTLVICRGNWCYGVA